MNPNIDKLPVPNTAPAGMNAQSAELGASVPAAERVPSQEVGNIAPPQASLPAQAAVDVPITPQTNPAAPVVHAAGAASPASDLDPEFEKRWVDTAKAIVERTKGDPHLQSQELSKTGEEYRRRLGRRVDPSKE